MSTVASWLLAVSLAAQPPAPAASQPATPPPTPQQPAGQEQAAAPATPLKSEELEQLAAPIALYPDALLAQVLMASTYPLEVVQAARWAKENSSLKGDALEEAVQKQPWEASVKSLAAFPQVLTMMNDKLDWTQKIGDAFLAQQDDLMAAVQTLRKKAREKGNLKTTKEQKVSVETAPESSTQVIVIEPASPQVVYVPTYNPAVVYGAWPYPAYPPYSYYPAGYVAAGMITFGVGMAVGAALWGGVRWGYRGGSVNINNVNNFNRSNRTNVSNRNWSHNSSHRRGVQYRDSSTAQRFNRGGNTGAGARDSYRGRSGSSGAGSGGRSGAFQKSGSGGQARAQSARGSSSRSGFSGRSGGGMRGGGGRRR